MNIVEAPPPVIRPHRITSHSKLSEIVEVFKAPEVKMQTKQRGIQPWEKKMRTDYYIREMKMGAKKAESPNLTLREIQTGKKDDRTERVAVAISTYFAGIALILFIFGR